MKLLSVTFENLNSLRGRHRIDFRHPAFAPGLFAIVGQTGAGKSTVLDAICLALYHQTPRLGSISSENEVMSRHTGYCMAEVEFETSRGAYRATWEQSRARKKPAGALQQPKAQFARLTGEIVTSSLREKIDEIVKVVGLTYAQFIRSVMLTQGEFAAFLKCSDGERAELLEKLTGTAIYGEISQRVYARTAEAARLLQNLNSEAGGIMLLDAAICAELETRRVTLGVQIREHEERLSALRLDQNWRSECDAAQLRLAEATEAARTLDAEVQAQEPARRRLEILGRADRLRPLATAADSARHRRDLGLSKLNALTEEQATLRTNLVRATWTAWSAAQATERAAHSAALEAEAAIRLLHNDLDEIPHGPILDLHFAAWNELATQLEATRLRHHSASLAIEHARTAVVDAVREDSQAALQLAEAEKTRELLRQHHHAAREALDALLDGETIDSLMLQRDALRERYADVGRVEEALRQCERSELTERQEESAVRAREVEIAQLAEVVELHVKARDAAERRHTDKQNLVNMARLVQKLEEHRTELVEGEPCALCGATEHPYAEAKELPRADQLTVELDDAAHELKCAVAELRRTDSELTKLQGEQEGAQRRMLELRADCERARDAWRALCLTAAVAEDVDLGRLRDEVTSKGLAVKEKLTAIAEANGTLTKAARAEEGQKEICHQLKQAYQAAASSVARARAILEEREATANGERANVDELEKRFSEEVLGGLPDNLTIWLQAAATDVAQFRRIREERARQEAALPSLHTARDSGVEAERLWRAKWNALRESELTASASPGKLEKVAEEVVALEQRALKLEAERCVVSTSLVELDAEAQTAVESLSRAALDHGFRTESDLRDHLVAPAELSALRAQVDELRELHASGQAVRAQALKDVERLLEGARTEEPLAAIAAAVAQLEEMRTQAVKEQTEAATTLHADAANRARLQHKLQEVADATSVLDDWTHLNSLIGSADGKKFRQFAQGLTLDRLVSLANQHLSRLDGGRYIIRRGAKLEIRIIDSWEADAERDAKTLSGGESFLVSLALALGLSDLVSHSTSIDCFFLDEGFGTLDENALHIALNAMEVLQAGGKLIGVISHVPLVKERIPTQVHVVKGRGDGSWLELPA